MESSVSVASATGAMSATTATALPVEELTGVYLKRQLMRGVSQMKIP